jgi:peptidoglycan hydrolase-like protein with peptidoglycan-binding domain
MSLKRVLAVSAVTAVAAAAVAAGTLALHRGPASPAGVATAAVLPNVPGRMHPAMHPAVRLRPVLHYPTLTEGMSGPAVVRLQELLADTEYLPFSFHPTAPAGISPLAARPGGFHWRFAAPPGLRGQFQKGEFGAMTRGAVMTFETQHGLSPDGIAGPLVWKALLFAAHHGRTMQGPYVSAYVSETLPESITIYQDDHAVFRSPVNTGIPGRPTALGTYPVYLRFTTTTMRGTNPDGTHYDDPGIPWVSYFNGGDAVHGYIRASYGFPQSLGCVELPFAAAHRAFGLMTYGTLVTVAG